MDQLESDYASILLSPGEAPCISLYQPTHRHHPERTQDQIRFRNLIRRVHSSLRDKYEMRNGRSLVEPFYALADDYEFWKHVLSGLAVLARPGLFKVYRLQRPVPELVVVADSFHTKPLLRILQSADRYQILGLNRVRARLFEGNRDEVDELDPAPGVPVAVNDVIGEELGEPERKSRVYGSAVSGATTRHGTDLKAAEMLAETERFFRAVDRAVLEFHSRPTRMALLLAAPPQYHHLFRTITRNPFLLSDALDVFPDAISLEELRARAWEVIKPYYLNRLSSLIDRFVAARSKGLGSDDLEQVAAAAATGRVEILLIEAERTIPGMYDSVTGAIDIGSRSDRAVDDLLDDVGERVLKTGSDVVVVPSERMPTNTGVAATYRF